MNALVPLHFEAADVRMVMRDGVPWWCAVDIVPILDYHSAQTMVRSLDPDEKGYAEMHTPSASGDGRGGGLQKMMVISLSGLLACTIRSHSPRARVFRRWVTGEVLPAILKYGFYDPARLAALQAEESRPIPPTQQERFFQEVERYERRTGFKVTTLPDVSDNKLRQLKLGAGLVGMLDRGKLWAVFVSAGFDMHYVLFGQTWGDRMTASAIPSASTMIEAMN